MSDENILKTPSKYEYAPGESENSNDSEWGLEIVIKSTPKKRRKNLIDEQDEKVIKEVEKDIEETLEEKAAKSNLSHATVKSILKHVFTDEHVLALVKKIEGCEDVEGIIPYEPKITRSKAKELQLDSTVGPVIPLSWQAPAATSEVQALLTEDLQEESSGDEYVPGEEESEDETSFSYSASNPPTPAVNLSFDDEIFKTPKVKKRKKQKSECDDEGVGENNLNIALRTRSKLSLSQTPLEKIEEAFIPPDVTLDMYETECNDDDWKEFLKSFMKPLEEVVRPTTDEDEHDDPEYNVLLDEEINTVDKEELRADKAVKVPKRELNDLMAELFEYVDIYSKGIENSEKIKENVDNTTEIIIENVLSETEKNDVDVDSSEYLTEILQNAFTNSQILLLEQQMRQHVQLLTQTFILTHRHPVFHKFSIDAKEFLLNLKFLGNDKEDSKFKCSNFDEAMELIQKWEELFEKNDEKAKETIEHFEKIMDNSIALFKKNVHDFHLPFPPLVLKTICESKVFIYPFLLPKIPYKHPDLLKTDYTPFSKSEFQLIAMALEQFIPHFINDKEYLTLTKTINIRKLCYLISSIVMPGRKPSQIYTQITDKKKEKHLPNPIAYYYLHKKAPLTFHQVLPLDKYGVVPPNKRRPEFLPRQMRRFIYPETDKLNIGDSEKLNPKPALIFSEPKKEKSPRIPVRIAPKPSPVKKTNKTNKENTFESKENIKNRYCIESKLENLRIKFRNCFRKSITYVKYSLLRGENCSYLDNFDIDDTMLPSMPCLNNSESNSSFFILKSENSEKKDDAEEINALMVASTTVKPAVKEKKEMVAVIDKKRARKKKDFLANIAMLSPPDPSTEKDKREQFAMAYFEKLKETLDDEEFKKFRRIFQNIDLKSSSENAVDLYKKIEPILTPKYPDLADEFLLFLNEEQANAVGKLIPFFILNHMDKFMRNLEIYFKDQPAQLRKIYRCFYDLNTGTSANNVSIDKIKMTILPLLRGNPLLCDGFLQIFLEETPTSTLMNGAWEIIDVNKELNKGDDAIFESITVPDGEDPNCSCSCHKIDEQQPTKQHCINCGLRFVQGKVYCQTSRGLKPVKISFPFDKDVDHTARLSALSRKKIEPTSPNKRLNSPSKEAHVISTTEEIKTSPPIIETESIQQQSVVHCKSPKSRKLKVKTKNDVKMKKEENSSRKGSPKKIRRKEKSTSAKPGSSKGQIKRLAEDVDWKNLPSPEYLDVQSSDGDDESSQDDQEQNDLIWTRDEDKIILETFQKNFDGEAVRLIAERLKNRKVEQIIARFEQLMRLLEEMAKSDLKLKT